MTIQTVAKYIWREIHRGNTLVIAGCVACYFWIALPIYKEIKDWLSGHDEVTAYSISEIEKLKEELADMKKKTTMDLHKRESGKIGKTEH